MAYGASVSVIMERSWWWGMSLSVMSSMAGYHVTRVEHVRASRDEHVTFIMVAPFRLNSTQRGLSNRRAQCLDESIRAAQYTDRQ